MQLDDKRFLVAGTGKSGVAAVSLLSKKVKAMDGNQRPRRPPPPPDERVAPPPENPPDERPDE